MIVWSRAFPPHPNCMYIKKQDFKNTLLTYVAIINLYKFLNTDQTCRKWQCGNSCHCTWSWLRPGGRRSGGFSRDRLSIMHAALTSCGAPLGSSAFWVCYSQFDGVLVIRGFLGDAVNFVSICVCVCETLTTQFSIVVHVIQQTCWTGLRSHLEPLPAEPSHWLSGTFFLGGGVCVAHVSRDSCAWADWLWTSNPPASTS